MSRSRIFTTAEVADLIAKGQTIVISEGRVLRLDGWIKRHPGGRLAIMHMVGRDATDEINVYHSNEALARMDKFRIGRIQGDWINISPPIQGGASVRADTEADNESTSDDGSEDSNLSVATSATSIDRNVVLEEQAEAMMASGKNALVVDELTRRNNNSVTAVEQTILPETVIAGQTHPKLPKTLISRDKYADQTIQEEIDLDVEEYPDLDLETQLRIKNRFQELHRRVQEEGFYDCRYIEYGKEFVRYSMLFGGFLFFLRAEWYITSACFLGIFWQQIMFTAHDGGHLAITHNFTVDTLIAMFVGDFCCGLSIGWWKSSHNVHHLVTNSPEHDPDIQNIPLFATSPSFFKSIHSSYYDFTFVWDKAADIVVQYQHWTYYPIMAIARFNLYLLSWLHLLSPRSIPIGAASWTKPMEILFMSCYWYLFGYCLLWCTLPTWTIRVAFVLVSHVILMLLHVQITLSHFAMSTADLGPTESFPQHQLRTTMDVDCPAWLDWFHGGLQFQAVHHLFPRVPRHNLRRLQVLVREFCKDVGIEYKIYGFADGNKKVIGRLGHVAAQVEMLVECQRYMAETGESGLH